MKKFSGANISIFETACKGCPELQEAYDTAGDVAAQTLGAERLDADTYRIPAATGEGTCLCGVKVATTMGIRYQRVIKRVDFYDLSKDERTHAYYGLKETLSVSVSGDLNKRCHALQRKES